MIIFSKEFSFCQSPGRDSITHQVEERPVTEISQLKSIDTLDKIKVFGLLQSYLVQKDTATFYNLSLAVSKDYYYRNNKHQECITFLKECDRLLNYKESSYGSHYLHLGNHYLALDRDVDALNSFQSSLEWYKKYDPVKSSIPLANIANFSLESNDYKTALALYLEALTYSNMIPDSLSRYYNLSFDYFKIAELYYQLGDTVLAKDYYQKSLKASVKNNTNDIRIMALGQAIEFYSIIREDEYTLSLIEIGDSILTSKNSKISPHYKERYNLITSNHYLNSNQIDKAIHPSKFDKSNVVSKNERLKYSARYYELIKDQENELLAYKDLVKIKFQNNDEYKKVVSKLLQTEKEITELHSNSQESSKNITKRNTWILYLFAIIIGLAGSFLFYKIRSNKLEKKIEETLSINTFNIRKLKEYREVYKQNKDYFTSVAHDIRSPLMKLVLTSEQLQSKETKDKTSLISGSQKINKEIDSILSDLEHFLRERKKETSVIEKINIKSLFDDCALLIDSNIIKPFNLKINGNTIIECNRNSLQVILKNCIENSMKYTSNHSVQFIMNIEKVREMIVISLIDNNRTGQPELLTLSSEKNITHNREIESYGLGLEICKNSAERIGGWFEVDNQYVEGFKVNFSLKSVNNETMQ